MVTLLQKKALQKNNAKGNNYKLEYNGTNVNGKDTTKEYYYVQNQNCTSQIGGYGSQVPLVTLIISQKHTVFILL